MADSAHEKYDARGQGRAEGDAVALEARRCGVCGCWSMYRRRSKHREPRCMRVARAMKKSEFEFAFAPPPPPPPPQRRGEARRGEATRDAARRPAVK